MHIQLTDFCKSAKKYTIGKGQPLQQNVLGKLDIHSKMDPFFTLDTKVN